MNHVGYGKFRERLLGSLGVQPISQVGQRGEIQQDFGVVFNDLFTITPYLAYRDRGTIVLCRTSNPDSNWLQNSSAENPVYLRVAKAAVSWNVHRNVLLVAGATQVEELKRIRQVIGDMPLLVPGIGAQGGDLEAVVRHGADSRGAGLIINAARSILYADSEDPAAGASAAAADLLAQIRNLQAKYRLAG